MKAAASVALLTMAFTVAGGGGVVEDIAIWIKGK